MIHYKDNNILIRSMLKDDPSQIMKCFKEQNSDKPLKVIEGYYEQQENNEKEIIIAELNGLIAGYTTLHPEAKNGAFAKKGIPIIIDLIVFKKYQNKGIGNKIMEIAEKLAKKKSNKIGLAVGLHSGYGTAQRLYIKRCYMFDGTGAWYKGKQVIPYSNHKVDDELNLYLIKDLKDS